MQFRILRVPLDPDLDPSGRRLLLEQVGRLDPEISEVLLDGDELVIRTAGETAGLEAALATVTSRTAASHARVRTRTLGETDGSGTFRDDPHGALERRGDLRFSLPGVASYQGELLRLMDELDAVFRTSAAAFAATEQRHPTTVATESLIDNGYLAEFPHHAILAGPVDGRADLERLSNADAASLDALAVARPSQVLAPTVCYHVFEGLRGERIPSSEMCVTAVGSCHRHEGPATHGLDRLQTFTLREIVTIGTGERVQAVRDTLVQEALGFAERLGLRTRVVTATDPFFVGGLQRKRSFQSMMKLKYELEAWLPWANRWVAVASFNYHQSSLVDAYDIRGAGSLHSMCVGYGLERWALALCSAHGPERRAWPVELRSPLVQTAAP